MQLIEMLGVKVIKNLYFVLWRVPCSKYTRFTAGKKVQW